MFSLIIHVFGLAFATFVRRIHHLTDVALSIAELEHNPSAMVNELHKNVDKNTNCFDPTTIVNY